MKAKFNLFSFTVLCILWFASACGPKTYTSYTLSCAIEGLPEGTKMELVPRGTHKDEKPVAEASVQNGKFVFTGETPEPRMFYVRANDVRGAFGVMVENGNIRVSGQLVESGWGDSKSYRYENISIKGSPAHNLYLRKRAARSTLDSLFQANQDANRDISAAMSQARMAKDQARIDSISSTEAWKKYSEMESTFFQTVGETVKGIIMNDKGSWWGPFFMLDMMTYFTPEQRPWFEEFSQEAKDSYYGKIVAAELFPASRVGASLPQFKLADAQGNELDPASLLKGKRYILIDFWASWCAPCRKEIPNLKTLYKRYAAKGFEIVSISIDSKKGDWEKALKEEQLPWPNFLDTQGAKEVWAVRSIPAMFLLDATGKIIAEDIRGEELVKALDTLLK